MKELPRSVEKRATTAFAGLSVATAPPMRQGVEAGSASCLGPPLPRKEAAAPAVIREQALGRELCWTLRGAKLLRRSAEAAPFDRGGRQGVALAVRVGRLLVRSGDDPEHSLNSAEVSPLGRVDGLQRDPVT